MKVNNNRNNSQIKIWDDVIKHTTQLCYLEFIVRCDGECYDDKAAFNDILPMWNSKKLKLMTKIF
jgi:hypothetical protein